jgi:spore coat protein U-like protein
MNIANVPGARAVGLLSLALGTAFVAAPAAAQSANANLSVDATVTANCTISTSPLSFGNVNTISGSNVDGTGGISVVCTSGTAWAAEAGVGTGSGASFASRRMVNGANVLSYNLYTDSGRSTVWGDGSGGTATIASIGSGVAQGITIYGRVNSGQTDVPAGAYTDTISVTVTY